MLESELFGHVAGAFTGAIGDKIGKFKLADGGTIFLDEIGTASPAMQVKLLRVLQEFEFEQVGGTKTFKVDARVILATNENLEELVRDRAFPPGSVLSRQRDQYRAAAAARPRVRHSAVGRAFPQGRRARNAARKCPASPTKRMRRWSTIAGPATSASWPT